MDNEIQPDGWLSHFGPLEVQTARSPLLSTRFEVRYHIVEGFLLKPLTPHSLNHTHKPLRATIRCCRRHPSVSGARLAATKSFSSSSLTPRLTASSTMHVLAFLLIRRRVRFLYAPSSLRAAYQSRPPRMIMANGEQGMEWTHTPSSCTHSGISKYGKVSEVHPLGLSHPDLCPRGAAAGQAKQCSPVGGERANLSGGSFMHYMSADTALRVPHGG